MSRFSESRCITFCEDVVETTWPRQGEVVTYFSRLTPEKAPPITIGFLAFDGMTTLDLTGPMEAFATARTIADEQVCYKPVLIGITARMVTARSGAIFKAQYLLRNAPTLDTVIIPGGATLRKTETSRVLAEWLLQRKDEMRRIASVSTGIFPLAESGLLDARNVTTHWKHAQELAQSYRQLQVDPAASFLKDDRYYTCGGGTAGIEMSLSLIEEDYGSKVALRVARELVVNLRPPGGGSDALQQLPYYPGSEERLAELPAWISSRLCANLSVEVLAQRACLCPRHFSRLFKQTFRSTPANYVERLRISEAARRLTSQSLSVEGVAAAVGFRSAEVFRRAFERRFGVPPRAFAMKHRSASEILTKE